MGASPFGGITEKCQIHGCAPQGAPCAKDLMVSSKWGTHPYLMMSNRASVLNLDCVRLYQLAQVDLNFHCHPLNIKTFQRYCLTRLGYLPA
jgi:hypothetical protein